MNRTDEVEWNTKIVVMKSVRNGCHDINQPLQSSDRYRTKTGLNWLGGALGGMGGLT